MKAAEKPCRDNRAGGAAVLNQINEKHKAAIVAHGMSEEEFNWAGNVVTLCKSAALRDTMVARMKDDLDKQVKANLAKVAELKKTLAAYEAAQKSAGG